MAPLSESTALVFFDIDGTLLNEEGQIPTSAVAAIKQLQANGHLAFLNTGRAFSVIQPHILAPGFDGIVAACGTWIQFRDEQLVNITIGQDLVRKLIDRLSACGVHVWFEGPRHVYVRSLQSGTLLDEFLRYFTDLPDSLADWHEKEVHANKLSYMLDPDSRLDDCLPFLEEHFYLIRHMAHNGEIIPKGYSKATGMRFLMDRLGVPRERTYAFGDSLNDIDMLSFAGHGIAMASSRRHVLAISDHVTGAPDEDGIAEGLKHFGLI